MRRFSAALLALLLLAAQPAFAGWINNPFTKKQDFTPAVEEADGSPSIPAVRKFIVTNGSLTDDGGGQATLVTGGGGGGGTPGGSTTQVQFNDAGSFGGDPGFVYDKTTDTATVGQLINSGLTASRAVVSDGSKQLISSATTATEIGYLSGVTSAIQTQLNAKQATISVSGTLLSQSGATLSVREGTLTDEKVCTYESTGTQIECNEAETGSGSIVRATSPTLVTPVLGDATFTSLSGGSVTSSSLTSGRVTIAGASGILSDDPDLTFSGDTLTATKVGATTQAGHWQLGENTNVALDAALSADGKWSGITEAGTLGETVAFGEVVYFKAADSKYYLTDADADATAGAVKIGVCLVAGNANGATTILLAGKVRADAKFPTLTIGAPVYISTTAGAVQVAQPSGTDDVIRIVGHANTADELSFFPSPDYMTHT